MSGQLILITVTVVVAAGLTAYNVERKRWSMAVWTAFMCLYGIAQHVVYFCKP